MPHRSRFTFGPFTFDSQTRELFRDNLRIAVPQKPLQLLDALLTRAGALVTREELRRGLWSDDTFVDFDANLNVAVRKLRECLGDDAERPTYIETLPRRGYRFIAPVSQPRAEPPVDAVPVSNQRILGLRAASAILVAVLVLAALPFWRGLSPQPTATPVVLIEPFDDVSGAQNQQPLVTGLTAELLAQLARDRAGEYRVIESGQHRTERSPDPDFVVQGSAYEDADGLHVTARLRDGRRGELLWAGTFACPQGDAASIRRQLASKITTAVTGTVRLN